MTGYQSKKAAAQAKLDSMEREALKLALEVLLDIIEGSRLDFAGNRNDDGLIDHNGNHDFKNRINNAYAAINKLKKTLAQPEQEPWRESASDYERGFIDGRQKQAQSSVDKAVNRMAQRPWVGLTDEEAQWLYDNCRTPSNLIDMVEAKLKEKNNAA